MNVGKETDRQPHNDSNTNEQGKMFANLKQKMLEKRKKQNEQQSQRQGLESDRENEVTGSSDRIITDLKDQLLSKGILQKMTKIAAIFPS